MVFVGILQFGCFESVGFIYERIFSLEINSRKFGLLKTAKVLCFSLKKRFFN